jgi:tetratricopeptide (TPR) repeat protein
VHVPESRADAERFFHLSIAANDRSSAAYADLGRLYEGTGRMAEADAAYARAVELGIDDAEVYLLAGSRILRGGSGYTKARPLFQRATELDPTSAAAWCGLGATYLAEKVDGATGIAALKKSLELNPNGEDAAFYLAQLWANEGNFDAARKLAQRLLARTTDAGLKKQLTSLLPSIDRQESAAAWSKTQTAAKEALALIDLALPKLPNEETRKKAQSLREMVAAEMRKR